MIINFHWEEGIHKTVPTISEIMCRTETIVKTKNRLAQVKN